MSTPMAATLVSTLCTVQSKRGGFPGTGAGVVAGVVAGVGIGLVTASVAVLV